MPMVGSGQAQLHAVIPRSAVAAASDTLRDVAPNGRVVTAGDLAVVVTPVESGLDAISVQVDAAGNGAEAFGELESLVRSHEAVVEALLAVTSVVPFRLGLVVRTDEDAARLLEKHAEALAADLRRVDGSAEWAVRVWEELEDTAATGTSHSSNDEARDTPGTAYLLAKRRLRDEAATAAARQRQRADDLWNELASIALDASLRTPVAAPAASGAPQQDRLVLDAVVLVDRSHEDRLQDRLAEALARHGGGSLHAELTGPWPPYHFVGAGDHA